MRVGVDSGGTFTDVVAFDPERSRLVFHKVGSTPDDPAAGIVSGALGAAERAEAQPADVAMLIHGTTVATNQVLQRAGARVALITTAGFRDVLHIQRQSRPLMYDLRARRTAPLVPRELRFEVRGRMRFDGTVQTPVDRSDLAAVIDAIRDAGVQAVAVGLLHSYTNPLHEREIGEEVARRLPGVAVSLSHELMGEHGEFERFSTCVMNAFVQPGIERYVTRLGAGLREAGFTAPLYVMKSNGGVMTAESAARRCVETVLSGPAGGVVAGAAVARARGAADLITCDMGGTSFDVGVIQDGDIPFARDTEMGGLALGVPMLDLHTVGAGGGSIAWLDAGNALRVGPRSAGAVPGPACYGTGGSEPTVTDADLVLGRLGTRTLLGGGMTLDREAAERAIHDRVAAPLGLDVAEAAEGIVRVINATMTAAIRKLTIERGHDPRRFALCPFGGAGPMHGAELAAELGVAETVIPIAPGVHSALGLLMTNLREDRTRTLVRRLDATAVEELSAVLGDLEAEGRAQLRAHNGVAPAVSRAVGQRYLGQRYELSVPVGAELPALEKLGDRFHALHDQRYGYRRDDHPVEVASAWVAVEHDLHPLELPTVPAAHAEPAPRRMRAARFAGVEREVPVYVRDDLGAGCSIHGPAIIEQLDATSVVPPDHRMVVDRFGHLVVSR
ncbi:MAG: hydantoinase/oxoprolinase family protein [Spirochaetaceae bacterium]|nr:hydantoinase/oxoprolinase family protein [Spirochaetaceae bacterium]